MSQVHVSTHPLVLHKLTLLRDVGTDPKQFRELVGELAQLLFFEATRHLHTEPYTVQTPLAQCEGVRLRDRIGILPILRAGLGMADAILQMVPQATVRHLGLYRDHVTHKPITYYNKLPEQPDFDVAIIVDPMLATGGSAVAVIDLLKRWGVKRIKFIGLIAAPEGVRAIVADHPDVPIYLAALDSHLDENAYIVPGLGDAGDRQFAT
jgi:uracil phosphoribosyltransferase